MFRKSDNQPLDIDQLQNLSSEIKKDIQEIGKTSQNVIESGSQAKINPEIYQCDQDPKHIADLAIKTIEDIPYAYYCVDDFDKSYPYLYDNDYNKLFLDLFEIKPITDKGKQYLTEKNYYTIKSQKNQPETSFIMPELLTQKQESTKQASSSPKIDKEIVDKLKREMKNILKKPILMKSIEFEKSIKSHDLLKDFKPRQINQIIETAIEELIKEEILLKIDLTHKDYIKYTNFIQITYKMPKKAMNFYALKKEFEAEYEKIKIETIKEVKEISEFPKKKEKKEEKEGFKDIPLTIHTCSVTESGEDKLPDLTGIYRHYEDFYKYFISKGVFVEESLLRKMLLAVEKDTPMILYGEPGDGKSLIVKTFLDFLSYYYNGGANPLEGKSETNPINPNAKKNSKYGISWKSMNIDESTSPLTLFGGYSPESIGKSKEERKENVDLGIISKCVLEGKYCFLDEMNRTENEVLGRLMGFLQEPFSYEVPEGNMKFVFKNPASIDPRQRRSNLVFIGTMNIGDVGNFKMSFAFKRRFKIIHVSYTTEQIVNIIQKSKGWSDHEINKIFLNFSSISTLDRSSMNDLKEKMNWMLDNISKAIYDKTHEWKNLKVVTFGVGVAHIMQVLNDISLFIQDLIFRKYENSNLSLLNSNDLKNDLKNLIADIIDENIIMSLIDENDRYKIEQIKNRKQDLIFVINDTILSLIDFLYIRMKEEYFNYKFNELDSFKEVICGIFKWSKLNLE